MMAGYNRGLVNFFSKNPGFAKWLYNISYFPQLGMMRHDAVRKNDPIVKEAVKRLPKDLAAERQFRISRALHLSYRNTVLPRSEWMKLEDDVPYLDPYIKQVVEELEAKKKFESEISAYKMPVKTNA